MIDEKDMKKMKRGKVYFFRIWVFFWESLQNRKLGNPEGIMVPFEKMIRKVIGVYAVAMTGSQGAMLLGYRFNVSF